MRIVYVEDEAGTRFLASEKMAYLEGLEALKLADEVRAIFGLATATKTETEEHEEVKP